MYKLSLAIFRVSYITILAFGIGVMFKLVPFVGVIAFFLVLWMWHEDMLP